MGDSADRFQETLKQHEQVVNAVKAAREAALLRKQQGIELTKQEKEARDREWSEAFHTEIERVRKELSHLWEDWERPKGPCSAEFLETLKRHEEVANAIKAMREARMASSGGE